MTDAMSFVPRPDLLTLEELERLARAFVRLGVRKLRLTGGEPLVRRNIMDLIRNLGGLIGHGLDELTLTTNATRLGTYAPELVKAGVKRINVSLDTLDAGKFRAITKHGDHALVLAGIEAVRQAGLKVKINTVAMKGVNEDEVEDLARWCAEREFDLSFIETMPMGDARSDSYLPVEAVKARLAKLGQLIDTPFRTGGPARYMTLAETGQRIGFITPLSHNFCESCNRVRLTCTGKLYLCLGKEDAADLRTPMRQGVDEAGLDAAILEAIGRKPKGHDFVPGGTAERSGAVRAMSVTGG
jgi:cyclic pyranopterin phosphate synthase